MGSPLGETAWLNSLVGAKGDDGEKGQPGDKGEVGEKGDDGAKGDQGETGIGEKGQPGEKGATGDKGETGAKGEIGVGEKGEPSTTPGPKGDEGDKGEPGEKGSDGSTGTGITMKGSVADVAALNALPGPHTQGDAYIVQADDSLHIWNGSAWVSGGSIQGPQGDKGEPGQKGEIGVGQKGEPSTDAGPKGEPGDKGATGDKGEVGEKGDTGNPSTQAGPKGDEGEKGAAGEKGDEGGKGEPGETGDKGETGSGQKGETGDKGEPGSGGVPAGGSSGQALVKASNTDYDVTWGAAAGGGGTLYFARVEYNSGQQLGGVEFLDPSGNGDFETSGATVGTIAGNNVDLTFSNEITPPKEIIAYGYQANASRYVITQLDGGGNNASFYALGATESAHSSNFGIGNQVTTDIMTNFGSAKLTLDVSMGNLDALREAGGFGSETKEAHAFIIFRF